MKPTNKEADVAPEIFTGMDELKRRLRAQGLDADPSDEVARHQARFSWDFQSPEALSRFKNGRYPGWISKEEITAKTAAGLAPWQAIQSILAQAWEDFGLNSEPTTTASTSIDTEEIVRRLRLQGMEIETGAPAAAVRAMARASWSMDGPSAAARILDGEYPAWISNAEINARKEGGLNLVQAVQVILAQACSDAGLHDAEEPV